MLRPLPFVVTVRFRAFSFAARLVCFDSQNQLSKVTRIPTLRYQSQKRGDLLLVAESILASVINHESADETRVHVRPTIEWRDR